MQHLDGHLTVSDFFGSGVLALTPLTGDRNTSFGVTPGSPPGAVALATATSSANPIAPSTYDIVLDASGTSLGAGGGSVATAFASGSGGFGLTNTGSSDILVSISVDWTWAYTVLTGDLAADAASGLIAFNLLRNGSIIQNLVNESSTAPFPASDSLTSLFQDFFSLNAGATDVFSIAGSVSGTARSVVASVPEPASFVLLASGLIPLLRRKKRMPQGRL